MAIDSNRFPLQSAIKKILDDPNSRPILPDGSGDGTSVGDDNFGKANRYDTGAYPHIALNNENVVVEVHQSQDSATLLYHLGKVNGDKIDLGVSHKYDNGRNPSVAINNNGLVVEVHHSEGLSNTLWYRLGQIEGDTLTWRNNNKSVEYDSGEPSSIAINDNGLVVEVHRTQGLSNTLWYRLGQVQGDTIAWRNNNKSIEYDNGISPSVAINNNGLVVEVHDGGSSLWYRLGQVQGDTIAWRNNNKSIKYDSGISPSVAITDDELVVEVHQSDGFFTLWYRLGQVQGDTIAWRNNNKSIKYGNEYSPSVACNGEFAVETHVKQKELWSSVLTLPAFRSNWIELHGDNSYCYCACNSSSNNKQRYASDKTMNVKEGAPYLYAVFTKDDDTVDFPTGAVLTIEGPDGTKYNHDIQEENQLVIMSGSSVRCLVIKDPKPGDWKMTMTVPEGVGFHCECNTVPSKDPYKTITDTLSKTNQLQKRGLSNDGKTDYLGWLALGAILGVAARGALIGTEAGPLGTVIGAFIGAVTGLVAAVAGQSNVATAVENQITEEPPNQPTTTTTTATALANTAQTYSTATPTPVLPSMVRVATWNVYPRTTRGTSPLQRILRLLTETVRNNFDIIVFQEVPQSLLRQLQVDGSYEHQQIDNAINNANQRYEYVVVDREYPANGRSPASSSTNGYLIVYNTHTLRLTQGANFYQPDQFLEANSPPYVIQARPPVELQFTINQTNTSFRFYTWHVEAPRASTNIYPTTLYNLLRNQGGHWVIAGDLNVIARNLPANLGTSNNELHHYDNGTGALDHVISDGTVHDASFIALNDPRWNQLFLSDVHYVLFARIEF